MRGGGGGGLRSREWGWGYQKSLIIKIQALKSVLHKAISYISEFIGLSHKITNHWLVSWLVVLGLTAL